LVLFLCSLAVRVLFWLPPPVRNAPPRFDEKAYFMKGAALVGLVRGADEGAWEDESDVWSAHFRSRDGAWERVYGGGAFPPLQGVTLAAGFLLFGDRVAAARLAMVLLSALTTPVIFLLTRSLASRRAAILAAVAHMVYPDFIAFSHLLWSETTYLFWLLLSLVWVVRVPRAGQERRALLLSAGAGLALGLAALTRAAALPFLLLFPLWVAWTRSGVRKRLFSASVLLIVAILVLLPWEILLVKKEGALIPLSSSAGFNVYLGATAGLDEDEGNAQGVRWAARKAIRERARATGASEAEAARELALQAIRSDPASYVHRSFERLQSMWTENRIILRQFALGSYPELSAAGLVTLRIFLAATLILFVFLAACGLWNRHPRLHAKRWIVLGLLAAGIPPLLTVASSRMALPVLALLLPAVGLGLDGFVGRERRGERLLPGVLFSLLVLVNVCVRWSSFPW